MEHGIDADVPLDYATIQIFPTENRYEAFVCGDGKVEKLVTGLLEQLLPHLPGVNKLNSKGSNANFKLQVGRLNDPTWFTKSTFKRFLQIVASPDLLNSSKLMEGEMSQLEEARKFHLSLHAQRRKDYSESGETDDCNSIETVPTLKPEVKVASSDTSKDELLQAMDLRLAALRREFPAALNQAAGATCSLKDIINLIEFCDHFGAAELKNSLSKFLELSHKSEISVLAINGKHSFTFMSGSDNASQTNGETQKSRSMQSQTPLQYGVSPAIVAQVERQSSTESESSYSSDENQISAERSRALTRSAQPRRSASPMRRIQIGRSGSRRSPALTIKSLGHYPARERIPSYRDVAANSSEEEGLEQISKKPENNVRRMTVQDAINLFESKQKNQGADAPKSSSSSNLSLGTNKSVLRRWSAGIVESSVPCRPELVSEDSVPLPCNDVVDGENSNLQVEEKLESDFASGCQNPCETDKVHIELKILEKRALDPVDMGTDTDRTQGEKSNQLPATLAGGSPQKEELNQMLKKMMETQPVRTRKPQSSRNKNMASEHRGGFYDHYKEKRDEKLRVENAGKKAEKEAQFRALQQTLDEQKAEMASRIVKDAVKKHPSSQPQKSLKNPSQSGNLRNESPKASVVRKVSSKASTLPPTRKSWPSTPSSRVVGSSPSKAPVGNSSAGTTPTRRKPQATTSLPRSSAKVGRSQLSHRNVKESQTDSHRSLKGVEKKMQQTVTKSEKTTKTKVVVGAGDDSGMVSSRPRFYNKMTKKSSVVPLESKPFLRKGSGVASVVGPIMSKTKHSSQLEKSSVNSGNMIETADNEVAVNASVPVIQHQDQDIVLSDHANAAMSPETMVNSPQNCNESENVNEFATDRDDSFKDTAESSGKIQSQEDSMISPILWEQTDECQNMHSSYDDGTCQLASPVHVESLGLASSRVRHSLSQMLQEDSSEPDTVEWGNAENPPAMVYQKDAPKGLKRLLKFARKSKGDANLAGWLSPSVFSEGEDDTEESKAISKPNTDNLLRKAALHSKNYGQQTTFFGGHEPTIDSHKPLSAQSNLGKLQAQNSHKSHMGHISTATSSAKATRSFFSLSAFRGSKPNDTKLH